MIHKMQRFVADRILTEATAWTRLVQTRRWLTTQQTSAALRPFFFAVHPDLFGKYPKERAVNEESIKHLNEHLEKKRRRMRVNPVSLQFYMRPVTDSPRPERTNRPFQRVKLTLQPKTSVQETVRHILSQCDLSLDYVNSLPATETRPATTRQPSWKVTWDPSFYRLYGIKDPNEGSAGLGGRSAVCTLSQWLDRQLPSARRRLHQTAPVLAEVSRLRGDLCRETGVRAVVWDCGWGQGQYRAALTGLLRVCRQHAEIDIADKTVIFSNVTGLCCNGDILLRSDDVAESWVWLLRSSAKYTKLVNKLPAIELYLSTLLGDIQVSRRHHRRPALQLYLRETRRLAAGVRDYLRENPQALEVDLSDLRIIVECMAGPMLIAPSGELRVPSETPAFLLINFLNKNADAAREKQQIYNKTRDVERYLTGACLDRLGLSALSSAPNITPDQYVSCLKDLLAHAGDLGTSLRGCRVQVSQFYSVLADGEICVPWDFSVDG